MLFRSPVPAPTIVSVSPSSGPPAGGTRITITGTGFAEGATVTVGGSDCTNVTVTPTTEIACDTPGGSGAKNVVVTNPDAKWATATRAYTYVTPTPEPTPPDGLVRRRGRPLCRARERIGYGGLDEAGCPG